MPAANHTGCLEIPVMAMGPLLDLVGAPTERSMSPRLLMGFPQPLSVRDKEALEALGVLRVGKESEFAPDIAFENAARVLLNPRTNLTIRLLAPNGEVETNVQFPGSLTEGDGVTLNRIHDRYRVKWPVSAADIYTLLHDWFLSAVGGVRGHSLQALLEPDVATTFFGVTDLLRARNRLPESKIEKHDLSFDQNELREVLDGHEAGRGIDDLRLYVALVTGRVAKLSTGDLDRALAKFVTEGVLEKNASKYTATGVLAVLCDPALNPERAIHWHQGFMVDTGELAVRSRVAVQLGQDLMLVLDAMEDGVMVRAPSSNELVGDFRNELGQPTNVYGQNPERQSAAKTYCPGCGVELGREVKFCTKCGVSVSKEKNLPVCPSCKKSIRPGVKYCTNCGQHTNMREQHSSVSKPQQKFCTKCGAKLKPGLNFCTSCDQPVSVG